jgi:hypothetical protein
MNGQTSKKPATGIVTRDADTTPARPSAGSRTLGWTLMTLSLGLVSCQSLFVL